MDKRIKEHFIRLIEKECKNYYKTNSQDAKERYEIVKNRCLEFGYLSEDQIKDLEEHMKEQHGKR